MKNLFKQISHTIKEELPLINKKINGTLLLELLKFKIIETLRNDTLNFNIENNQEVNLEEKFEDESRILKIKLSYFNSDNIKLNIQLKKNILIICIKESIDISIKDYKSKKNFNFKAIPITGLTLSNGSECSLSYGKKSIVLELNSEDKLNHIEKLEEKTI